MNKLNTDWAIDFPASITPTMKLSSDKFDVALLSVILNVSKFVKLTRMFQMAVSVEFSNLS